MRTVQNGSLDSGKAEDAETKETCSSYTEGFTYKSTTSVTDYFSQKLSKIKSLARSSETKTKDLDSSESCGPEAVTDSTEEPVSFKKMKNKRKREPEQLEELAVIGEVTDESSHRKKKTKHEKNQQFEENFEKQQEQNESCNLVITDSGPKRKKAKTKGKKECAEVYETGQEQEVISSSGKESIFKKKKKLIEKEQEESDEGEEMLKSCLKISKNNKIEKKSVTFKKKPQIRFISPKKFDHQEDELLDSNKDAEKNAAEDLIALKSEASISMQETNKDSASTLDEIDKESSNATKLPDEEQPKVAEDNSGGNSKKLWAQQPFSMPQLPVTESMFGNNNNSWSISIKMAEKMTHYASVIKNIKVHEILSTTNLLDIRGYGN